MKVKDQVVLKVRQLIEGSVGLLRLDLRSGLAQVSSLAALNITFLFLALMGLAWSTVAIGLWMSDMWDWKAISIWIAVGTLALASVFWFFAASAGTKLGKDKAALQKTLTEEQRRILYQEMIADAQEGLFEISERMETMAGGALNPVAIAGFAVKKNPVTFLAAAVGLGIYLGTRRRLRQGMDDNLSSLLISLANQKPQFEADVGKQEDPDHLGGSGTQPKMSAVPRSQFHTYTYKKKEVI